MSEADDLVALYMASLANEKMVQVAEYVQRGRRFATWAIEDANAHWVALFKQRVKLRIADKALPAAELRELLDVEAEFTLRGVEPPHDRVPAEMAIVNDLAAKTIAGIPANDFLERELLPRARSMETPPVKLPH